MLNMNYAGSTEVPSATIICMSVHGGCELISFTHDVRA